jgi:vitamin K-dependent gamma-carboxylase
MDLYLGVRSHFLLGKLYSYTEAPRIFSWGGLVFDLLIVPALIWRPTRLMALASAIFFHISNSLMFGLATFPWFSLLMSTMFFDPSWPRKIPGFSILLPKTEATSVTPLHRGLAVALGLYVLLHLALPFRHHFYPGDASWTEEGHMFAWRMMLRNKTGNFKMWVKDKTNGTVKKMDPNHYLTKRQFQSMVGDPDLILQFAHFIKKQHHKRGQEVEVYASSLVSLNGKEQRELLKQGIDLSTIKRSLEHYAWVQK